MPIYSESLRNTRLDAISAALGTACIIRVYSGTPPATVSELVTTQTQLVQITGNVSAFAPAASGGQIVPNAFSTNNIATATGIPTFARFGPASAPDSATVMQITAGVNSGELQFSRKIVAGSTVNLSSMRIFESEEIPTQPSVQNDLVVIAGGRNCSSGALANIDHSLKAINGTANLSKVKIWTGSAFQNMVVNHTSGNHHGTSSSLSVAEFGPEVAMAFEHEAFPGVSTDLYLIKHAEAGQMLSSGTWQSGGVLRTALISHINAAKTILNGNAPVKFIWIHGETEADSFNDEDETYEADLISFLEDIKTQTNEPNMRVIIVHPSNHAAYPGRLHSPMSAVANSNSLYELLPTSRYSGGLDFDYQLYNGYDEDSRERYSAAGMFQIGNHAYSRWFGGIATVYNPSQLLSRYDDLGIGLDNKEIEIGITFPDGFGGYTHPEEKYGLLSRINENGREWALWYDNTGLLKFEFVADPDETGQNPFNSSVEWQMTPWPYFQADTQYVIKIERIGNLVKLYVDGDLKDTLDTVSLVDIGGVDDGGGHFFLAGPAQVGNYVGIVSDEWTNTPGDCVHANVDFVRYRTPPSVWWRNIIS